MKLSKSENSKELLRRLQHYLNLLSNDEKSNDEKLAQFSPFVENVQLLTQMVLENLNDKIVEKEK